jgi:hypothetical protein
LPDFLNTSFTNITEEFLGPPNGSHIMWTIHVIASVGLALALPNPYKEDAVQCPVIFDGRVLHNYSSDTFDSDILSPYSTQYVKGENLTWSQIILMPRVAASRFDKRNIHRPLEVTINDLSVFRSGQGLQLGFRRAGLLLKNDKNAAGADAADQGVVTFHWSVRQDPNRPLNLSHEYMNVWHERSDYNGNQFTFTGGVVLPVDGGTGIDTPEERNTWKIQDSKNEFLYQTLIQNETWQNFAVQLDYMKK